jgi:hypothetical protein
VNAVLAIVGTFVVLLGGIFAMSYVGPLPELGIFAVTAIWAAIDVGRLKFAEYNVVFPSSGILAVLFVLGFWIVGFPMFLAAWLSIVRKTAKRRAQVAAA